MPSCTGQSVWEGLGWSEHWSEQGSDTLKELFTVSSTLPAKLNGRKSLIVNIVYHTAQENELPVAPDLGSKIY